MVCNWADYLANGFSENHDRPQGHLPPPTLRLLGWKEDCTHWGEQWHWVVNCQGYGVARGGCDDNC